MLVHVCGLTWAILFIAGIGAVTNTITALCLRNALSWPTGELIVTATCKNKVNEAHHIINHLETAQVVVVVVVMVAFSSLARIWGETLTIHSQPALVFVLLLFFVVVFFEVEISSCTLIPLFMPGSVHSGSASWNNCGRIFPNKLPVSSFLDKVPALCLDSSRTSSIRLCWVKGACMFSRMTGILRTPLQ